MTKIKFSELKEGDVVSIELTIEKDWPCRGDLLDICKSDFTLISRVKKKVKKYVVVTHYAANNIYSASADKYKSIDEYNELSAKGRWDSKAISLIIESMIEVDDV